MILEARHPELVFIDCRDCWLHDYDEDWKPVVDARTGKRSKRPWNMGPPCTTRLGCPKGTIGRPKALTPANEKAYSHYHSCAATGCFPDDSLVFARAGLMRRLEQSQQQANADATTNFLTALAATRIGGAPRGN